MSPKRKGSLRSRSGFTLVEAIIVVVVLGLMTIIAFPKMSAAMSRSDLRSARTTMANLVVMARVASMQSNRVTWVKVEGGSAFVGATPRLVAVAGSTIDTVGVVHDLSEAYDVTLAGVDSIRFDPRGFGSGFGSSGSITLSRGSYSETITIDGLGRVTK
jgi:Tfp pilus assembly protein FimT